MSQHDARVLIATHAVFQNGQPVHGPAHILFDFLAQREIPARLVEFPLSSGLSDWPRQVRSLTQTAREYRPTVFIGIDPLNGWAGRTLRRRGLVPRFVYHTPDYSPKRFAFGPLNAIYHWVDRAALAAADDCWTVSSRITAVRQSQGRNDARTVFNGIPFDARRIASFDASRRSRLVLVGNLNQTMDLDMLLGVIASLRGNIPGLHLDIIGDGEGRQALETRSKQLDLEAHVTFHGNQPLDRVLELLTTAGIGIALYSGAQGFNYYGDSKKIREYSALGLPVITTPVVVNAAEITSAGAGLVVEPQARPIAAAIEQLATNPSLYRQQHEAALALAKATDLTAVLTDAFTSIGVL